MTITTQKDWALWAASLGNTGGDALKKVLDAGFTLQQVYHGARWLRQIQTDLNRGDSAAAIKLMHYWCEPEARPVPKDSTFGPAKDGSRPVPPGARFGAAKHDDVTADCNGKPISANDSRVAAALAADAE